MIHINPTRRKTEQFIFTFKTMSQINFTLNCEDRRQFYKLNKGTCI